MQVLCRIIEPEISQTVQTTDGGTIEKEMQSRKGANMDDERKEKLKEISANLYTCKVAVHYVDDPQIIDDALMVIIRQINNMVDED